MTPGESLCDTRRRNKTLRRGAGCDWFFFSQEAMLSFAERRNPTHREMRALHIKQGHDDAVAGGRNSNDVLESDIYLPRVAGRTGPRRLPVAAIFDKGAAFL